MDKQELETKQKAFASSIVSLVYAFVIQLTQNLTLVPNHPEIQVQASIFVPAIASILFGKLIGAAGAAGGQFVDSAGSNLIASASNPNVALTGLDLPSLLAMVSNAIGAYIVGSLTEKPSTQWDSFIARFTNMDTWSRLFQNTLGSIIGLGMVGSLLSSYSSYINNPDWIEKGTSQFVESFFLNSAIIVIFIPLTLLLYEFGDILVQMRAHAKDKSLRKLAKTSEKEEAVTILSARLTENALAENQWTPVLIRFRANLDQTTVYRIEAVSTANYHPPFDATKPLKKGDVWEQKFFIMPAKQKKVDFKIRITPAIDSIDSVSQNIPETIVQIKGKSYNPNSNSATLVLFSIINSIMVGASVVWNNILSFNVNDAIASLQKSWVVIASTGTLEVILFVPLLMYLRRRWTKTDAESLTIGFGTDLSERSQKIFMRLEGNVSQLLDYFSAKLQRSVKLFLVFVTTVSVLLLGLEGYNKLTEAGYTIAFSDQLFIIGVLAIVLWLGGYKGIDILKSAGIIGEEKYEIQEGNVLKKFNPATDFFTNTPNEVAFTITNPTEQKGIRFRFLGQDTVSPPLVEMPVPPGGSALFKTSITPIQTGTRNLMVVVYPLFDENGQYIDENSAEPYTNQYVNYQVQSETQIGISKDQQSTLKKLIAIAGVVAAIVFGGGAFAQQLLGDVNLYNLVRDNAPFLLALQGPFVYAYFYIQNKSKLIKGEMDSLIEQINAMDDLAKSMNQKLDQNILKSKKFSTTISSSLKNTLSSVAGLSALKELNEIVSKQISTTLGEDFTKQITKVVKDQDLTLFSDTATKVITDNFSGDITKMLDSEKSNLMSSVETQVTSQASGSVTDQSADTATTQTVDASTSQDTSPSAVSMINDKKNEVKDAVKTKIKEKYGDKIKKQTSKELTQILKDKSSDSFIGKYKEGLMVNFKKTLTKEFKKQIKDGTLVDDIEEKVLEALGPDIQAQILEQLNSTIFNRDILSSVAEELDSQLGSSLATEFEDTIGTAMESEMGEKLKQHLNVKYEKEVMDKLNKQIKRRIVRELNKRGDTIIDELLNSKLTDQIQNKMVSAIQDSVANNIDGVVDKAIDLSVDQAFVV